MVEVFLADPEGQDPRDLARAWDTLDPEERARANALVSARDRQTFIVAHALLRCVLARQVGGDAAGIRFERTLLGRPELAKMATCDVRQGAARDDTSGPGVGRFRFNLSHTQGLVGCAITATHDIGLDLEEARMPAPLEVAQRYFSGGELERLWALPPTQQHDRFYALWTLKESYIKGCGRGLAIPLDSFTVEPQAQGATKLLIQDPDEDARAWTLRWWRFDRHFGALAVRAASPAPGVSLSPGQRIATLAGR